MRNLKKILALVLALMMVLSVMVTASAADFTDADEIDYAEAVEVMTSIGMLEGYNGAFNPDGTLDRASAAKIIAFALLGNQISALGSAETGMSDVPASHWASAYVAYCAQEGIINGYNGKFNPTGELDGYGFAKMLLCALGIEGTYTGDTWTLDVAINAKNNHLLDGMTVILSNKITRQEACQMAFNAMNVGEYVEKYDIETKYAIVSLNTYGTDASAAAAIAEEYDTFHAALTAATKDYSANGGSDLSTKLYGTDFTIVNYSKTVNNSYVTKTLLQQVHKVTTDLGADVNGRPCTLYIKGGKVIASVAHTPVYTAESCKLYYTDLFSQLVADDDGMITLNRVVNGTYYRTPLTFFKNTTGGHSVYGKAVELYYVAPGVYTLVEVADKFATVTSLGKDAKGVYANLSYPTGAKIYDETLAIDDKLIVNFGVNSDGDNVITEYWLAETFVGVPTWTNATQGSVIIDGEKYYYGDYVNHEIDATDIAAKAPKTFALDSYGNIVNVGGVASVPNYVVVLATGTETTVFAGTKDYAKVLKNDGTIDTVEYYKNAAIDGVSDEYTLVSYNINLAGQYVFSTVGATGGATTVVPNKTTLGTANVNANTVFVVEHYNALTDTNSYATYTGVANVPAVNVTGYAYVNGADSKAALVYLYGATPVAGSTTMEDLVYVSVGSEYEQVAADRGTYYEYDAISNGEVFTITTATAIGSTDLYAVTVLPNGYSTVAPFVYPAACAEVSGSVAKAVTGGTLNIGGSDYTYDANTVIYVDEEGYGFTQMTVAEFITYANTVFSYQTATGTWVEFVYNYTGIGYTTNEVLTELFVVGSFSPLA